MMIMTLRPLPSGAAGRPLPRELRPAVPWLNEVAVASLDT